MNQTQNEHVINEVLTTKQLRALACQNGIKEWKTDAIGTIRRKLLELPKEILDGFNG